MDTTTDQATRRPSAFRRAGTTVAVACAVGGSILGVGAVAAFATPSPEPTAAASTSTSTSTEGVDPAVEPAAAAAYPKATFTAADRAAFAASPYADEALALAAIWGVDTETAAGQAGAALQAGRELPFAAGASTAVAYTQDQQLNAFFFGGGEYEQALGLSLAWGTPDVLTAKARIGGLELTGQAVPAAPASYTDEQAAAAYALAGYGDVAAGQFAAMWQVDVPAATVRAGHLLLAGEVLPELDPDIPLF